MADDHVDTAHGDAAPDDRLTGEQLQQILLEVVNGLPPTLRSPAADEARAQITKQVAEIEARGGIVDIPSDWAL